MIWFSAVVTGLIVALQSKVLWRKRRWPDLLSQATLLGTGLVCSAAVSLHWWLNADVLAPVKAVFTPITEWIYTLL